MINREKITNTFKEVWIKAQDYFTEEERNVLKTEIENISKEFDIVLFGLYSGGKSSFLNYLLGEKILPVKKAPTTEILWKIRNLDKKSKENVLYRQALSQFKHVAHIKKGEEILSSSYNANTFSSKDRSDDLKKLLAQANEIELLYDFDKLFSHNVVFWDTPGLGDETKRKLPKEELLTKIGLAEICVIVGSLGKLKSKEFFSDLKALFDRNKLCKFIFILRPEDGDDTLSIKERVKTLSDSDIKGLKDTNKILNEDIYGLFENGKKKIGIKELIETEISKDFKIFPLQIRNIIKIKKANIKMSTEVKRHLGMLDFEKHFYSLIDEKTNIIIQNKAKIFKEYIECKIENLRKSKAEICIQKDIKRDDIQNKFKKTIKRIELVYKDINNDFSHFLGLLNKTIVAANNEYSKFHWYNISHWFDSAENFLRTKLEAFLSSQNGLDFLLSQRSYNKFRAIENLEFFKKYFNDFNDFEKLIKFKKLKENNKKFIDRTIKDILENIKHQKGAKFGQKNLIISINAKGNTNKHLLHIDEIYNAFTRIKALINRGNEIDLEMFDKRINSVNQSEKELNKIINNLEDILKKHEIRI